MKFGEKVRLLRNEKKLSQTELGKMCGLSLRTIRNYEVDGRYPKQREVLQAQQSYGYKGAKDAEELVADVSALFAGGELSENDKDAVMRALQDAYWMAKERNKEKYTPKKYRNPIEVEE